LNSLFPLWKRNVIYSRKNVIKFTLIAEICKVENIKTFFERTREKLDKIWITREKTKKEDRETDL
jgi:hypothetical protein